MPPPNPQVSNAQPGSGTLDDSTLLAWCELAFDRAPVPVVLHCGGRIRYTNGAARKFIGAASPDQLVGKTILDFIHPEMHPLVAERLRRMAERIEALRPVELRLVRLDGQYRDAEIAAWVVATRPDPSVVAILQDVTPRRQAAEALHNSEERFRGLFEDAPIAYHEIDIHGVVKRVNRAECELLGFRPEELLGRPVWEQVADDQRKLSRERVAAKLAGKELLVPFERFYARHDGTRVRLEVHENLIRDQQGNVVGIRSALLDVTEKRQAEERLEAFSQQLQANNAELSRALRAACEAAELKSQFLANMSHEIRTPMNGVIGMTGLAAGYQSHPEQREYAETVRKSGRSAAGGHQRHSGLLQNRSRPAADGIVPVRSASADRGSQRNAGAQSRGEQPRSHDRLPSSAPRRFVGDGGRIRQVLTNLVGNAVKFTPAGGVAVTVECLERDAQQIRMRIAVEDTGIGIPQEKQSCLFQKFSQVDGSATRKFGGTGLGLAICKQLVELMGGVIGVESCLGTGSTFWFTLPLTPDTQPDAAPVGVAHLRGLRVLIVDDNAVNRRVLEQQTASWGMESRSLARPFGAIAALHDAQVSGRPYDFVLLDYQMPGMDGAALAEAIKTDPALQDVPLIMLTSVGHWNEVRRMEGTWVDASLAKPVRQLHLLNTFLVCRSKQSEKAPRTKNAGRKFEGRLEPTGARVLVAEDNVVNQRVAVRMLERLGLRADVAANGREAVALFRMAPYDVILMDCQMPEMDGFAATREIRRLEDSEQRVVIVAMTAEAMTGVREKCLAEGMDDYICKPVKLEDLYETMRKWVSKN